MFAQRETSRTSGQPISLYKFSVGDSLYLYTSAEQPVDFSGGTYLPVPINHGAISASGTLDKARLTVTTASSTDISELFRVYPPSEVVGLIIFQGHANDPDGQFVPAWSGRILGCSWGESNEVSLSAEPISTSLKRPGLRMPYQYGCPHALYGDQCRASKTAATLTVTAQSVNRSTVTLPAGWSATPDKFVGGIAEWTESGRRAIRTILQVQAGQVLLLGGGSGDLTTGMTLTVAKGCNHQLDDCETVHNNVQNFGGCNWIPTENPIGFVNKFY